MGLEQDTIVAISTPVGRGGIGVVRLSGTRALAATAPLLRLRHPPTAGRARFGEIVDVATGDVLDQVVVTYFAAPNSYTGEDVVEIAAHGAPVLLEYIVRQCCAGGARLAEPAEGHPHLAPFQINVELITVRLGFFLYRGGDIVYADSLSESVDQRLQLIPQPT